MSEWYDRKWILSRLPHDIPQDIVDHAFDGMGQYYVKKTLWKSGAYDSARQTMS